MPALRLVAAATLAALVWLVAAPGALQAQDSDPRIEEARALFWEGNHDYVNERYEEAIEHFVDAYALSNNERLLDYIGRCYANLGDLRQAIDYYEQFAATSTEAEIEARPTLDALRDERLRLVVGHTVSTVEDAVSEALGEQPPPRDQRRRELGTRMRDVPIVVESVPIGAEVFIDDLELGSFGTTPLETRLFTGQHLIEVRAENYAAEQRIVSVAIPRAGQPIPTFRFELERLEVPVEVSVEPITANVVYTGADGSQRRLARGGFEGTLPAGPATFLLQQGGRDRRVEVTIAAPEDGGAQQIELTLDDPSETRRPLIQIGTLTITSTLTDCDVIIDGASVGRCPGSFSRDLTPGPHAVEVRRDGYVSFEQEVDVSADAETVIVVNVLERAGRRGRR